MPESQIKVQLNPDVTPAGSDLAIVNAARRSFNTRSEWDWVQNPEGSPGSRIKALKDKDKRLLEFLARGMTADDFDKFVAGASYWNEGVSLEDITAELWQWRNTPTHDTPFNHTFISFEVQAPIFCRAQLVKHEYLIMSEFSRRYITDDVQFYVPDTWRKAAENKKQGSSNEAVILNGQQKCSYCQGGIEFLRPEDEKMKRFCTPSCQDKFYRKCTDKGWLITKVARLKQSAKKRGIPFDLTWEELESVGMPAYCKYLEIELDYSSDTLVPQSPSVNRIDPTKGYFVGNIEIISNMANSMLLNATPDQMKVFIKNVAFEQFGALVDCSPFMDNLNSGSLELYAKMLEGGMAPEQARGYLPQNVLTEWTWSGTLGAFAKMCTLRLHPEAQYEARVVAQQVYKYLKEYYPVGAKALVEGV